MAPRTKKVAPSANDMPNFNNAICNSSMPPPRILDTVGVDYSTSQGYYNRDIPRYDKTDIWADYQKEGLLQQIVNRESSKLFTKWFTVLTPDNPDSDLPGQVKEAMEKYDMEIKLSQWHRSRMLFGCGWLMHQLSDVGKDVSILQNEPTGNYEYLDIVPISKNEYVTTKRSEDVYRQIEYYQFRFGAGQGQNLWNIHPARLILNKNDPLGVAPEGMSEVIGGMGHLEELMSVLSTLEVGLRNRCFTVPIIEYPDGMSQTAIDNISAVFKGINSADNIMVPRGVNESQNLKITFNTGFSALGDIQPLIELVLKVYSTTVGYPYALLFGTPAGGLSGSEMNSREYLSGLSAKLKLEYTPLIRKIIEDWRKYGVIANKTDKYEIHWPPLWEMTEQEEKTVLYLESNRAVNLNNMGVEFAFRSDGFIDNNSMSGVVAPIPSGATTTKGNVRSAELRNPGEEAEALRNWKTPEELVAACNNIRAKVTGLQKDVDFIRNEAVGGINGN